jgi:hypothetical protein
MNERDNADDFKWWFEDTYIKRKRGHLQNFADDDSAPENGGESEAPPAFGSPDLTVCRPAFG